MTELIPRTLRSNTIYSGLTMEKRSPSPSQVVVEIYNIRQPKLDHCIERIPNCMISYPCFANMLIRQLVHVDDPNSSREAIDVNYNKSEPGSETTPLKFCVRNAPACTRCGALPLNVFAFIRTSDTNCCSGSASSAVACLRTFPEASRLGCCHVRLSSFVTSLHCLAP